MMKWQPDHVSGVPHADRQDAEIRVPDAGLPERHEGLVKPVPSQTDLDCDLPVGRRADIGVVAFVLDRGHRNLT